MMRICVIRCTNASPAAPGSVPLREDHLEKPGEPGERLGMGRARGAGAENVADRRQVQADHAVLMERDAIESEGLRRDCPEGRKEEGAAAMRAFLQSAPGHLHDDREMPGAILAKLRCQRPVQVPLHWRDL